MLPVISSFTNLNIKMGQTTLTALPPGPWITAGMNTVFQANTYDFIQVPVDWMPVTLQTPFQYDNTKNFIVEVSHDGYTVGFEVMQATLSARSVYGSSTSPLSNSQNFLCDFGFDIGLGGTDASLEGFTNLNDTLCSGLLPVTAIIRNNGLASLSSVTVNWQINNIPQTPAYYYGSLPVNSTATVNLGSYNFIPGVSYTVTAWTTNPNNQQDPNPSNDTSVYNVTEIMPAPTSTPNATSYSLCLGDSLSIGGSLTGTPPWYLSLSDGTNVFQLQNIMSPAYSIWVKPVVNTTYSVVALTDISGCQGSPGPPVVVHVYPKPVVSIGPDHTIKLNGSVMLDAGAGAASYMWSTGATTQTITVTGSSFGAGMHPFSVTITNAHGCQGYDTVWVTIVDDTGIKENDITGYRLFPNPGDGTFYIIGADPGNDPVTMSVYRIDGRIAGELTLLPEPGTLKYIADLKFLPAGIYLIQITGYHNKYTSKLIINK